MLITCLCFYYKTTFRSLQTLFFAFDFRKHNTGSLAHLGEKQVYNIFKKIRKKSALNFDLEYKAL